VDTLIIIPNQNLFRLATENTTFTEAFALADDVLYQGVKGVTDLMVRPGLINLDFADVRAVMDEMGKAMMGTGEAEGRTARPTPPRRPSRTRSSTRSASRAPRAC
jgi:cell division protein FtsZ